MKYYLVNKETGKKTGWTLTYGFAQKCQAHNEKIVREDKLK